MFDQKSIKRTVSLVICIAFAVNCPCWAVPTRGETLRPVSSAFGTSSELQQSMPGKTPGNKAEDLSDQRSKAGSAGLTGATFPEAAEAVRKDWSYIENDIKASDPKVAEKRKPFLSRLFHTAERTMVQLEDKALKGEIDPFVRLRTIAYGEEPEDSRFHDVDRELRVGCLHIAGNPVNWGHILVSLMAMNALNLDTVVFRCQGEIVYKDLPESDRVPAKERHSNVKEVADRLFPLIRYTDFGSEPGNKLEGAKDLPNLLRLNPDRKIRIFSLIGVEEEPRVRRYLRQYYSFEPTYNIAIGKVPNHKLTISFIQRGEFGAILTHDMLDDINGEIRKEEHREQLIETVLVKDPDIDLKISSTYYRNTHDSAIVPGIVDKWAKEHGYYGFSVIDPRTGKPYRASEEKLIRKMLEPIIDRMGEQIIELVGTNHTSEMAVVSIDGGSGSGKTTVANELARYLSSRGYRCRILGLDMFLKERKWRHAIQKLVVGEGLSEEERALLGDEIISRIRPNQKYLEEELFFSQQGILKMLQEIYEFRHSDRETHILRIPNAYVQRTKKRKDREFKLNKKTVIIVDGKYANMPEFRPFYDIRYMLKDHPDRTKAKFEMRTRKQSPADADRQMEFYDLALLPSYLRYLGRENVAADHIIDISNEEWNKWELRPFVKASSAGSIPLTAGDSSAGSFVPRWNRTKALSSTLGEKILTRALDIRTEHIIELKTLEEVAIEAAGMLVEQRREHPGEMEIIYKDEADDGDSLMVAFTELDTKVQDFYINSLHGIFPNWRFIAEEGVSEGLKDDGRAEYICMIDPVDGTSQFTRRGEYAGWKFQPMFKHLEYGTGIALFRRLPDGKLKPLLSISILPEIDIDGVGFSIAEAVDDIEGAFLNGKRVGISRLTHSQLKQKDVIVEPRWNQTPIAERIAKEFRKGFLDVCSLSHFTFLATGERFSDIAGKMGARPQVWDTAIGGFIAQKAGASLVYLNDGNDFFPIDPKRIYGEFRTDSIFAAASNTVTYILRRLRETGDLTPGTKPGKKLGGRRGKEGGAEFLLLYPNPHSKMLRLDPIDRKNFTWNKQKRRWVHRKYKGLVLGEVGDIKRDMTPGAEFSAMKNDVVIRTKLGFSIYIFDSHNKSSNYIDDATERKEVYEKENIQLWIDNHSDAYLSDRKAGYAPGYIAITIAEKGAISVHIWVSKHRTGEGITKDEGIDVVKRHVKEYKHLDMESYFRWAGRPKNTRAIINICSDIAPSNEIIDFLRRLFEEDGLVPSTVHVSTSPSALWEDTIDATGAPTCYGDVEVCKDAAEFVLSKETLRTIERNVTNLRRQDTHPASLVESPIALHQSIESEGKIERLIKQAA